MSLEDEILAATLAHKTAMAVHAVMMSVGDLSNMEGDLTPNDLMDLELSHFLLGKILLKLNKDKRAA